MPPFVVVAGADAFGQDLKNKAVEYLKAKEGVEVVDLGTDSYHVIASKVAKAVNGTEIRPSAEPAGSSEREEAHKELRGLLVCGTGAGVSMIANKFPGIHAVSCNSADAAKNARSINDCNLLALSGLHTKPDNCPEILEAFLSTDFKAPCPANNGEPWSEDIQKFLDAHIPEIAALSQPPVDACPICNLSSDRKFTEFSEMPGCEWVQLRDNPGTAVVKFKAGSVEPAHHHTFSHDVVVISGRKIVQNVTREKSYELKPGDFLSTPNGDIHRVYYFEDTEFFIKWDGPMDILMDETTEVAKEKLNDIVKG